MTPELGHLMAIAALALALLLGTVPMWGAAHPATGWTHLARPLTVLMAVAVALAYAALTHAFITCDFSVAYVAQHANTALPLAYRVAAVWGGHEGSLLLWVLMRAGWAVAVAAFSRHLPPALVARVLGVMGWITAGFVLFMLFTSNPFERQLPAPPDGRDLNPLLQDPGMVLHPPMLYMGYVGFSVAFAFAVAALLDGRLDAQWARWSRPWTTTAWACLSLGILLGSWWAYAELGWGGWWFWDPVENASFMPWLAGTALMHSLAVTEKRNGFKAWTVLLAITTFSLSLLGTFLVRSGVLSSVHAFATDPERGLFILVFLMLLTGVALGLYAWRAPRMGGGGDVGLWSREAALLLNNVLLMVAMGAVLLGTVYPLWLDAIGAGKISVGPPYFETVLLPLLLALGAVLALAPALRWKQGCDRPALRQRAIALAVSLAVAIAVGALQGHIALRGTLGLTMACWIVLSVGLEAWAQRQAMRRAQVGMWTAHLGVALFALAVSMVKTYELERDAPLAPGEHVEVGPWRFTLVGVQPVQGPNYSAVQARLEVRRLDATLPTPPIVLHPERRTYRVQRTPMTEAAIDRQLGRDLYASLGEPLPDGRWLMRLQHKPLMGGLWLGGLLMALGGLLAASDRRYRGHRRAHGGTPPPQSTEPGP